MTERERKREGRNRKREKCVQVREKDLVCVWLGHWLAQGLFCPHRSTSARRKKQRKTTIQSRKWERTHTHTHTHTADWPDWFVRKSFRGTTSWQELRVNSSARMLERSIGAYVWRELLRQGFDGWMLWPIFLCGHTKLPGATRALFICSSERDLHCQRVLFSQCMRGHRFASWLKAPFKI